MRIAEDSLSAETIVKDLDLQWRDHFHMRDQTWKTLGNTLLFFLGTVGLEIKGVQHSVMIVAYAALILVAVLGYFVASHHRVRQKQKFALIERYETLLGLSEIKIPILKATEYHGGIAGRIFTARFIEWAELLVACVALTLLVRTIVG
jgi:disulfide bond formation protein DsbB